MEWSINDTFNQSDTRQELSQTIQTANAMLVDDLVYDSIFSCKNRVPSSFGTFLRADGFGAMTGVPEVSRNTPLAIPTEGKCSTRLRLLRVMTVLRGLTSDLDLRNLMM